MHRIGLDNQFAFIFGLLHLKEKRVAAASGNYYLNLVATYCHEKNKTLDSKIIGQNDDLTRMSNHLMLVIHHLGGETKTVIRTKISIDLKYTKLKKKY